MAFLVVLVLDDPDQCNDVLDAWEGAGSTGITILESTGIGRVRKMGIQDNIPLMPSLRELFQSKETHHRTLFSVVQDEATVDALEEATRATVGNLNLEETGFLFVLPVVRAVGLGMRRTGEVEP